MWLVSVRPDEQDHRSAGHPAQGSAGPGQQDEALLRSAARRHLLSEQEAQGPPEGVQGARHQETARRPRRRDRRSRGQETRHARTLHRGLHELPGRTGHTLTSVQAGFS